MSKFKYSHIVELGRNKTLSIAELSALLGQNNVEKAFENFIFIKSDNAAQLINRLGGSIKISSIKEITTEKAQLSELILNLLRTVKHDGKLLYGLNIYPISKENEKILKFLLKDIKNLLKNQKIKSRYLNKGPRNIHTALVLDSKILKKGIEMNIFTIKNEYLIGKTVGLQDINAYSLRDYKRPARDAKSGMLPPKFAQMLINLAHPYMKGNIIYDPFCGSGTILQEARLMGYEVIGSDISEKAVKDSQTNMRWLDGKFGSKNKLPNYRVFQNDITKNSTDLKKADAVICEGYLGPGLFKTSHEQIQEIHKHLIQLYSSMFRNIKNNVKKSVPLVLALPFHHFKGRDYSLKAIPSLIKEHGFKEERESIKYRRSSQIVGREIFVVTKK